MTSFLMPRHNLGIHRVPDWKHRQQAPFCQLGKESKIENDFTKLDLLKLYAHVCTRASGTCSGSRHVVQNVIHRSMTNEISYS